MRPPEHAAHVTRASAPGAGATGPPGRGGPGAGPLRRVRPRRARSAAPRASRGTAARPAGCTLPRRHPAASPALSAQPEQCYQRCAPRTHCLARLRPGRDPQAALVQPARRPAQQQRARSCRTRSLTSSSAAVGPPSAASASPVASARSAAAPRQPRSAARLTEHAASRSHSGGLAAARGRVGKRGARACSTPDTRRARPSMHASPLDLCGPTLTCASLCAQ